MQEDTPSYVYLGFRRKCNKSVAIRRTPNEELCVIMLASHQLVLAEGRNDTVG